MIEVNTNFTDYSQFLKPAVGNKVVMLKFEVENIDDDNDELYVSSLNFNAYVDSVAVESFYCGKDNYNDFSATIGREKDMYFMKFLLILKI